MPKLNESIGRMKFLMGYSTSKVLSEQDETNILTEQSWWDSVTNMVYQWWTEDDEFEYGGCEEETLKKSRNIKKLYSTLRNNKKIPLQQGDTLILIRGHEQDLQVTNDGKTISKQIGVSTASRGFGNRKGSAKTPTGLMRVDGKTKAKSKFETLVSKRGTGVILGPNISSDRKVGGKSHCAEVITGLLSLSGVESCNKNVRGRGIYIHGTNRERLIGQKASGGCIRIKNDEILELIDTIDHGAFVFITPY